MQSKSLLIAIAAFAVTATGVQAYGGVEMLNRAGLDDSQVVAIQEAKELRESGDLTGARDRLVDAGIAEGELRSMRKAAKMSHEGMQEALEEGDFDAFLESVSGSPLADIITSEADFEQFKAAHDLRQAGEWEEAGEIMADLGIEHGQKNNHSKMGNKAHDKGGQGDMTDNQREALMVARQSNDRASAQAILDEAGVGQGSYHKMMRNNE